MFTSNQPDVPAKVKNSYKTTEDKLEQIVNQLDNISAMLMKIMWLIDRDY